MQIISDVEIQGLATTTNLGTVSLARHVAVAGIDGNGSVPENDTTVTFRSVLNTGNGVTSSLAGRETFLNSHVGGKDLVLSPCERSTICTLRVASLKFVVCNDGVVDNREGRVLIDVDQIVAAACFGFVLPSKSVIGSRHPLEHGNLHLCKGSYIETRRPEAH